MNGIGTILDVETEKYYASKSKAKQIVSRIIHKEINTNVLLKLYDSDGISPEMVKAEAKKQGKLIVVPDNFYTLVAQMHEQKKVKTATKRADELDLDGLPETEILYWGSYKELEFEAKVLRVLGDKVVLDRTGFYPTSGGQLHDVGTINGVEVVDVFKQGHWIVHTVKSKGLSTCDSVKGRIDADRRLQLAIHHTATHVVNGAAKQVLGQHIWQAGAAKTLNKARLDITHYDSLSADEMEAIEDAANEIVRQDAPVNKMLLPRKEAEEKYGFVLYQGGAVPGKTIRVVEIPGFDVEACGGTHLDHTGEIREIKLIKSSKLQDGIVRLEYVAGNAVQAVEKQEGKTLENIAEILGVSKSHVPGRALELFSKWKKAKKAVKKKKPLEPGVLDLVSAEEMSGSDDELLEKTAEILSTQPQHIVNTISRFMKELDEWKKEIQSVN